MDIPFRCVDLCFNGGSCTSLQNASSFCSCPPGFGPDLTMGHYRNCALPDYFLLGTFLVSSLGTAASLIAGGRKLRVVKSRMYRTVLSKNLSTFLDWISFLCIVIQNGLFRPGIVFSLLGMSFTIFSNYEAVLIFSSPIFAATKKSMDWFKFENRVMSSASSISMSICLWGMFVAQDDDPLFNSFQVAFLFLAGFWSIWRMLYLINRINHLRTYLTSVQAGNDATHDNNFLEKVLNKLGTFKRGVILNLGINGVIGLALPIVIIVLGSLPFQYVFVVFTKILSWYANLKFFNAKNDEAKRDTDSSMRSPKNPTSRKLSQSESTANHHQLSVTSKPKKVHDDDANVMVVDTTISFDEAQGDDKEAVLTLQAILAASHGRAKSFEHFLVMERAEESWYFLQDTQNWKSQYRDISITSRIARAKKIMATYVDSQGSFAINIPDHIQTEILKSLQGNNAELILFDKARNEVMKLLEAGALRRFILHDHQQQQQAAKREEIVTDPDELSAARNG